MFIYDIILLICDFVFWWCTAGFGWGIVENGKEMI